MIGELYTFVGNKDLAYANPLSEAVMNRAIDLLELRAGDPAADFGAGFGELAIRVAERWGAQVSAVELSPMIAAAARERVKARLGTQAGLVAVHEGDAGAFRAAVPAGSFRFAACVGSTHALGGFEAALEVLLRLVAPGGSVLLGDAIWDQPPARTFLDATGMQEDEAGTFREHVELAQLKGLEVCWATTATTREWDEYEWAHSRAIERFARDHADRPEARAMVERSRTWRLAYARWGRGTLGFGLYLFRKPA